jgi:hypothetical protein
MSEASDDVRKAYNAWVPQYDTNTNLTRDLNAEVLRLAIARPDRQARLRDWLWHRPDMDTVLRLLTLSFERMEQASDA